MAIVFILGAWLRGGWILCGLAMGKERALFSADTRLDSRDRASGLSSVANLRESGKRRGRIDERGRREAADPAAPTRVPLVRPVHSSSERPLAGSLSMRSLLPIAPITQSQPSSCWLVVKPANRRSLLASKHTRAGFSLPLPLSLHSRIQAPTARLAFEFGRASARGSRAPCVILSHTITISTQMKRNSNIEHTTIHLLSLLFLYAPTAATPPLLHGHARERRVDSRRRPFACHSLAMGVQFARLSVPFLTARNEPTDERPPGTHFAG